MRTYAFALTLVSVLSQTGCTVLLGHLGGRADHRAMYRSALGPEEVASLRPGTGLVVVALDGSWQEGYWKEFRRVGADSSVLVLQRPTGRLIEIPQDRIAHVERVQISRRLSLGALGIFLDFLAAFGILLLSADGP